MLISSVSCPPVFSTPDIHKLYGQALDDKDNVIFTELDLDSYGQIDPIVGRVFPSELLDVIEIIHSEVLKRDIFRVVGSNPFYHLPDAECYVDSAFFAEDSGSNRERFRPRSKEEVLIELIKISDMSLPYVWGGTSDVGCKEMLDVYQFEFETHLELQKVIGQGFDCSGLIYFAHGNPFEPRNTSQMIESGHALDIYGRNKYEILNMIEPLDIIVWKGHVMIVITGDGMCLESRWFSPTEPGGIMVSSFFEIYDYIVSLGRKPVNELNELNSKSGFMVRRGVFNYS